jgi:hypothetical protein
MFFVVLISCIVTAAMVGSVITYMFDRQDWKNIENVSGWKMNIIKQVAEIQNQPLETVQLRQADICAYYAT